MWLVARLQNLFYLLETSKVFEFFTFPPSDSARQLHKDNKKKLSLKFFEILHPLAGKFLICTNVDCMIAEK